MEDISFNCDQYTGAVMGLEEMKCVSNDLLSTALFSSLNICASLSFWFYFIVILELAGAMLYVSHVRGRQGSVDNGRWREGEAFTHARKNRPFPICAVRKYTNNIRPARVIKLEFLPVNQWCRAVHPLIFPPYLAVYGVGKLSYASTPWTLFARCHTVLFRIISVVQSVLRRLKWPSSTHCAERRHDNPGSTRTHKQSVSDTINSLKVWCRDMKARKKFPCSGCDEFVSAGWYAWWESSDITSR